VKLLCTYLEKSKPTIFCYKFKVC